MGRVKKGEKNLMQGECFWHAEYPSKDSEYLERLFRRSFGVARRFHCRIHEAVVNEIPLYWGMRRVVGNKNGIRSTFKISNCLPLFRNGNAYDSMDDCAIMWEETLQIYVHSLVRKVMGIYGGYYLNRRPNVE